MKCSLILLISSIIGFIAGYIISASIFWGIIGAIAAPFLIVFYVFCHFVAAMVYPAEEDED